MPEYQPVTPRVPVCLENLLSLGGGGGPSSAASKLQVRLVDEHGGSAANRSRCQCSRGHRSRPRCSFLEGAADPEARKRVKGTVCHPGSNIGTSCGRSREHPPRLRGSRRAAPGEDLGARTGLAGRTLLSHGRPRSGRARGIAPTSGTRASQSGRARGIPPTSGTSSWQKGELPAPSTPGWGWLAWMAGPSPAKRRSRCIRVPVVFRKRAAARSSLH